jgi:oligosaccharide repeat unit polymerase
VAVLVFWTLLALVAIIEPRALSLEWLEWRQGLFAAALWGLNLLILVYGVGGEFHFGRMPMISAAFSLTMTVVGTGSYGVTRLLDPNYHVPIELAAILVALCTGVSLATVWAVRVLTGPRRPPPRLTLDWDWPWLQVIAIGLTIVVVIATMMSLKRIGYIPAITGDPTSERVEFPAIAGIWFRLSAMGGLPVLIVAVLVAARKANRWTWLAGLVSLICLGVYGARFYVVYPLAVSLVLWDLVRRRIRLLHLGIVLVPVTIVLALLGALRQGSSSIERVSPLGAALYGSFLEFRDLAWAMDYFEGSQRFTHGSTFPSVVVPLLPGKMWSLFGVDKDVVFEDNSANVMADAMGYDTGQRIGMYGEFFMNFGWWGSLVGALLYGLLIAWIDRRGQGLDPGTVQGVFVAMIAVAAIFAQIGQLNMFTSTITGLAYPLLLVVLLASRRRLPAAG